MASASRPMAGVAVADRPEGPFRFLKARRLHCSEDYSGSEKGMARDMNLFQDVDGTAYILYASEENATLYISRLNQEYTDLDASEGAVEGRDFTRNMKNSSREAPAMFRYQGKYYLMTSGCTGWDPNAAIYYTADSPMGPWKAKGNPCVGAEKDTTFRTQSTCIFPVDEANGKFLYMGDRWNRSDLADSRYVWLPVELGYSGEMQISPVSDWTVEEIKEAASVSLYQENTVYFVDCSKESSGFFDGFREREIALLNETGDQAYDGVWGLVGEPGVYNGDCLFGSGYWAKKDQSIVYRFTLPVGSYQVAAGIREWWTEKRQADEKAAAAVIEKIGAIGTVTLESKAAIEEARRAYEGLTEDQKKLVTNLGLLEAAETAYKELETPNTEPPETETPETKAPETETPDIEAPGDPVPPKRELKKGGVYQAGKLYYKVLSVEKREAAVVKPVKKTEKSLTIPASVKLEGVSCTVVQVAKNAFKGNKKLTKVTVGANVQVIGKNAFYGAKSLKRIVIRSKKLKKASPSSIRGISKKAVIQVPRAKKKAYTKLFKIKGKSGVKIK